ncbi:MAG TPA: hypothetical protein V6C71_10050 [Coleofasciculaceae cyanobacterium]|jgi:hypothetical protein
MSDKNLFLEPPETILESAEKPYDAVWAVVGINSRVVKNWRELVLSCPENAIRCYQHLSQNPMLRIRGRIFPLRGKKYKGAWEYEITTADRVFYVPLQS